MHQMVLSPRGHVRVDYSKPGHSSNSEVTDGLGSRKGQVGEAVSGEGSEEVPRWPQQGKW